MISDRATMEAERFDALRAKDAKRYFILSRTLGYNPQVVDSPELYEAGMALTSDDDLNSLKTDSGSKKPSPEELEDRVLIAVSKVLERFVHRPPRNSRESDLAIESRLTRISRIGYPVPDTSSLKGPQVFRIYLDIKDKVYELLRQRKIKR